MLIITSIHVHITSLCLDLYLKFETSYLYSIISNWMWSTSNGAASNSFSLTSPSTSYLFRPACLMVPLKRIGFFWLSGHCATLFTMYVEGRRLKQLLKNRKNENITKMIPLNSIFSGIRFECNWQMSVSLFAMSFYRLRTSELFYTSIDRF